MSTSGACNASVWTKEENKAFEKALAIYGDVDQWENIAAAVPGKTVDDIILHYRALVDDITAIEADLVPLPNYASSSESSPDRAGGNTQCNQTEEAQSNSRKKKKRARKVGERKRGRPWTEEEHRHFLEGLAKYEKGDWRSISRHHVLSRTPTQVASHAQKYFQRMKMDHQKKRASIHDITTVDTCTTSARERPAARGRSEVVKKTNNTSIADCIILESQPLPVCAQMVGSAAVDSIRVSSIQQMPFTVQQTGKTAVDPIDLTGGTEFTNRRSQQVPVSAQMMGFAGLDFSGSTSIPQMRSALQMRVSGERSEVSQVDMRGNASSSQISMFSGQIRGGGGIEFTSDRASQLMPVSAQMVGHGELDFGGLNFGELDSGELHFGGLDIGGVDFGGPLNPQSTGAAALGTSIDYDSDIDFASFRASELLQNPEQMTGLSVGTSIPQTALTAQPTEPAAVGPVGYSETLLPAEFGGFSMGLTQTPSFPAQMPVTTSIGMPMSIPQPTSTMYGITQTPYGQFIPYPPLNVAPSTSGFPPPSDQTR